MEIGLLEKVAAALLLVGLPLLATDEETVTEAFSGGDRTDLYASAGLSLALIAGAVWGLASWAGLRPELLGWRALGPGPVAAWGIGITAAGLASVGLATKVVRRLGLPESRAVLYLLPRDRRERTAFVALALAAGVCEEYVFRGFLLHVVEAWSGDTAAAVAASSLSFGLAHGYQRTAGVVRATLLGLLLALPVVATGSLAPAMAAHFGINVVVGLGGWRWLAPEAGPRPPGARGGSGPGDEDRAGSGDPDVTANRDDLQGGRDEGPDDRSMGE